MILPSEPTIINSIAEKTIPRGTVRVPIAWMFCGIMGILSLGVGYGGYRAGFQNQAATVLALQTENKLIHDDINNLRYDMGRLRQALEDLKESLDRKR